MFLRLKSYLFVLTFLWGGLGCLQGQEFIQGQLLDSKTNEPVVFASIYLENRDLGVISNLDGGFRIPKRYLEMGDILIISSLGYQEQKLSIFDLLLEQINTIRLEPAIFQLSEAVVKASKRGRIKKLSAEEVVQRAIDAILDNYPTTPYSQVGYYRDYQLEKQEYLNLNEAVLEVFDNGFKVIDSLTTKVLLYQYKKNDNFRQDTMAMRSYDYDFSDGAKIVDKAFLPAYGGNEFTILKVHDAIRNYNIDTYSFVNRLETDLLKGHVFSKDDDSYMKEEILFKIKFQKKFGDHSAYGTLFISKDDYSIYKMIYSVHDDKKEAPLDENDKNGTKKALIYEITTEYRRKGGKMFLSYISFNNRFEVWEPPKLKLTYVELEAKKKRFTLTFNKKIDWYSANDLKKYTAKFEGKKIKFNRLVLFENKVFLYPKLSEEKFLKLYKKIENKSMKAELNEVSLNFKLTDLKDVDGNVLDYWSSKNYYQFREFFVQQTKPDRPFQSYSDTLYMNRKKPIFSGQPTVKPDNFNDYWMNTPLQRYNN